MNDEDKARRLADFFVRLAKDPALYNTYLEEPLETMRSEGLPEDLIELVLQGDLRSLTELFAAKEGPPIILGTIVRG
jgi:hypothetical protein